MADNMIKIAGVRFRENSKVYDFDAVDIDIVVGDKVIVDSERGSGFAQVVRIRKNENPFAEPSLSAPSLVRGESEAKIEEGEKTSVADRQHVNEQASKTLRKILRKATDADMVQEEKNRVREEEAFAIAQDMIAEREIPMKLIRVEYSFDASRATFFFFSETRVDFRELVKDLAHKLKSRIEMRQIGVRDVARLIGGFGPCGRELCCASFLKNFEPVSIRMAKKQEMVLNPSKISGVCGRLLCCLSYEYEMYDEIKKDLADMHEAESKDKKEDESLHLEEERRLADEKRRQEDRRRQEKQKEDSQELVRPEARTNHMQGKKPQPQPEQPRDRQQPQEQKSQQPQQHGEKAGRKKRRRFWRKKKKGQQHGDVKPQGPEKA